MPFKPGQSGNPTGRPKIDRSAEKEVSIRKALERVVRSRPDLLEDTIERLLIGRGALGMLELAAKLTRELQDEAQGNRIAIVFTGGIDLNKLKSAEAKVIDQTRSEVFTLPESAVASTARPIEDVLQSEVLVPSELQAQEREEPR